MAANFHDGVYIAALGYIIVQEIYLEKTNYNYYATIIGG